MVGFGFYCADRAVKVRAVEALRAAGLARKDKVLRLVADDASSYSGALRTFPWERDSLFAALARIAEVAEAALGEQP